MAHLAGDLDIFVSKFRPLKYTISGRQEKTLMKIIVHVETNKACARAQLLAEGSSCVRLPDAAWTRRSGPAVLASAPEQMLALAMPVSAVAERLVHTWVHARASVE